ncbi:Os07g0466000 [Oryza sativa Japonica Group]|uniref:Os07g0466000 protein n=1 Tax=Oryza sativa subsp. japonica TaxID=39947 RepID=A0A0P0X5M3_ORYSJ|nr:Os07g0466000 [Oryza sativa Japonica Group]
MSYIVYWRLFCNIDRSMPPVCRDKEEHRRCVAACLVKGAYVVENDLNRRRMWGKELAPAWWENFGFRTVDVINDDVIDDNDQIVTGTIYEHETPPGGGEPRHPLSPRYVVAFRGTMTWHPKAFVDLYLDLQVLFNTLQDSQRFRLAKAAVQKLVDTIHKGTGVCDHAVGGRCVVWLVGHSLGASVALEVGRVMMTEQGYNLPTFLFNPPQVSPAPVINLLHPNEKAKRHLHAASSLLKVGLGKIMNSHEEHMEKLFERLSPWTPELYVHESHPICQGYIDYFEQRQLVQERFRGIGNSAMKLSYRDMFFSVLGKNKERPHLLPSALLWKNSRLAFNAHSLEHWWKPDNELSLTKTQYMYSYPSA